MLGYCPVLVCSWIIINPVVHYLASRVLSDKTRLATSLGQIRHQAGAICRAQKNLDPCKFSAIFLALLRLETVVQAPAVPPALLFARGFCSISRISAL